MGSVLFDSITYFNIPPWFVKLIAPVPAACLRYVMLCRLMCSPAVTNGTQ